MVRSSDRTEVPSTARFVPPTAQAPPPYRLVGPPNCANGNSDRTDGEPNWAFGEPDDKVQILHRKACAAYASPPMMRDAHA